MKTERPVALVTGGGRRLGRQIALSLGENGFDVVVNYNQSKTGAESVVSILSNKGVRAKAYQADFHEVKAIQRMVTSVIKDFYRVDVLVNSSATFPTSSLSSITQKVWDDTFNVNLRGMFFCTQAVANQMQKQKSGKIINIASIGGIQSWTKHIPYNVSKAGVIMLTRCLAKALAPNILVNAIAPGTIIIDGEESDAIQHIDTKKIPLHRYGSPKDITEMVIFLATRGDYITGQVFPIDGGRSIQ
jgi:NAD(P)-dependent dehydrogenase (short-subunit alcohol dehydrogenase family)